MKKILSLFIFSYSLCLFSVESNTQKSETPMSDYVQYEMELYMNQGLTEEEARQVVLEDAKRKIEEGFTQDQKAEIESKLGSGNLTKEQKAELEQKVIAAKAQWEKNTIRRYINEGMTEEEAKEQLAKDELMYRQELQSQLAEKFTPEQISELKSKVTNSNLPPEQKALLHKKLDQLKPIPPPVPTSKAPNPQIKKTHKNKSLNK
jgi:hypothetical protein